MSETNNVIEQAAAILENRKAEARQRLERWISYPDDSSPDRRAQRIVDAAVEAGMSGADLRAMIRQAPPQATEPRKVHLIASQEFAPHAGGVASHWQMLNVTQLCRGGRVDLGGAEVVPAPGQDKAESKELAQVIEDFNASAPGETTIDALVKAGISRGSKTDQGTATWLAGRFKGWQLRLALVEARRMLPGAEKAWGWSLGDCVLSRLGLANLVKPVVTGDKANL